MYVLLLLLMGQCVLGGGMAASPKDLTSDF